MRVSPGYIRTGIKDPSFVIPATSPTMVSTHSIVTKAVKLFHELSQHEAQQYLEQTFGNGKWSTGANLTKSNVAKRSFANYCVRANADDRPAALGEQRATVGVAGHVVAAGCDVVLLDPDGYEGRLCVWSVLPSPLTAAEAAIVACPIVEALEEQFDSGDVLGVDIWSLRSNSTVFVTAEAARGVTAEFNTLIRRLTRS